MPALTKGAIKTPAPETLLTPAQSVRWDIIVAAIAVGVIVFDQIVKALVVNHFHTCTSSPTPNDVVPVIGQIITFQYLCNHGTAFSLFEGSKAVYFLIAIAVAVIGWLYWTARDRPYPWLKVTFGMIIGGAIGNIIDRLRYGFVVDFIHFQIPGRFDFAVFNVADSSIVVGMLALALIFWLMPHETTDAVPVAAGSAPSAATAPAHATSRTISERTVITPETPTSVVNAKPLTAADASRSPVTSKVAAPQSISVPRVNAPRSAKYPNTVKSKPKKK